MNKFIQKLIDKLNLSFKEELEAQKKFFDKPDILKQLTIVGVAMLEKFLVKKYSEDNIKNFIKTDLVARNFIRYTSRDYDEEILSELLIKCQNKEISEEEFFSYLDEDLDFLGIANEHNDFDLKSKRAFDNLRTFVNKNQKSLNNTLTYSFLFYYVVLQTIDLIKNTEFPSKYRTRYIQRLIRNLSGLLKHHIKNISETAKKESEKLLSNLKQIDNLLLGLGMATAIYFINRKTLQEKSTNTLIEIAADTTCIDLNIVESSINILPFKISLDCPVELDDVITPHEPIEQKLNNVSCEILENEETISEVKEVVDLVSKAIIRNKRTDKMIVGLPLDTHVDQSTIIANFPNSLIYSPVIGVIEHKQDNQIILKNISDPNNNYLTKQINLLNEKYAKLNEIKSFLKIHYVDTLYPSMLSIALIDDASTYDLNSGVDKIWKNSKKSYERIDDNYEKQIKQITGKSNVETNAKNETLYKIKDNIESEQEIFYKYLISIGNKAINISKQTKAKSNEYELLEFYTLDLGASFNKLSNPSKLEIQFRDEINEYIRKRLIVDGFKKVQLEKKINEFIKDIEKGISLGNWFKKAWEIYKKRKKLSDLEKWLKKLADENNKLKGIEKEEAVNRIMFLFELYLNYENIVQKYTILKKETTSKKETIKEGIWISGFTNSLWKEFNKIPNEIEEIENIIDSLSLFTTYSITEYEGEQYRLYTIPEKIECEPKKENVLLDPNSKYDFKDIEYWFKYCAIATLASVVNPRGWSTGIIFPAPIFLPVIYIPIKSIQTKYGFIVLGISICGLYIFPWSLFVNYTTNYTLPFFDPTITLQNEIDALKKIISKQISELRKVSIKNFLDKTESELNNTQNKLDNYEEIFKTHRTIKPSKYPRRIEYIVEFEKWTQQTLELRELITTTKIKKWKLEQRHQVLNSAYKSGTSVKGTDSSLDKQEKLITDQLDRLSIMVDKVDKIIALLPISMNPETANFGITLKNLKPLIEIADELDDNTNETALKTFILKNKLKNEDLMKGKYSSTLSSTAVQYNSYKKRLIATMPTLVKKDPFPKYELLSVANIPFQKFLHNDFIVTGAKTYGFPGFLP